MDNGLQMGHRHREKNDGTQTHSPTDTHFHTLNCILVLVLISCVYWSVVGNNDQAVSSRAERTISVFATTNWPLRLFTYQNDTEKERKSFWTSRLIDPLFFLIITKGGRCFWQTCRIIMPKKRYHHLADNIVAPIHLGIIVIRKKVLQPLTEKNLNYKFTNYLRIRDTKKNRRAQTTIFWIEYQLQTKLKTDNLNHQYQQSENDKWNCCLLMVILKRRQHLQNITVT